MAAEEVKEHLMNGERVKSKRYPHLTPWAGMTESRGDGKGARISTAHSSGCSSHSPCVSP